MNIELHGHEKSETRAKLRVSMLGNKNGKRKKP